MCGILGIINTNNENVSKNLFRGSLALQHRGQDGYGITTYYENNFYTLRRNGLLLDDRDFYDLGSSLPGNIGISHMRYATSGIGSLNEIQPFTFGITLAGVHNGNIVNFKKINNELGLESNSDSESLFNLFNTYLSKYDTLTSINKIFNDLKGAFSIIGIVPEGLLAFRDSNGFKPLVIGNNNENFAFASESVVFDTLDFNLIKDVNPGSVIIIKHNGEIEEHQIRLNNVTHCVFEYIYLARPESIIDGKNVSEVRENLGKSLVDDFKLEIDYVSDVPSSAVDAALGFSEKAKIKYKKFIRKNPYTQRSFIQPNDKSRNLVLDAKFHFDKNYINNKKIAIVDDSIVRGNTAKKIISKLKKRGAKEIHILSSAPEIKYPCFYGVDMSVSEELIANNKTVDEIKSFIGCDSLSYQTVNGVVEAVGHCNLCMACFTGKYPVEIDQDEISYISNNRKKVVYK